MLEMQTLENKREYNQKAQNTMLAFLNTDGGTLYIGISDDGAIYGVSGKITNGSNEQRLLDAFSDISFNKEDAAGVLGISASGAYKLLQRMTERGLLVARKEGNKWVYDCHA